MSTGSNPVIGLDRVYVAKLLSDVDGTTPPTYGTPMLLSGAVSAAASNNGSVDVDYADNGPFFAVNSRGNIELNLELTNVSETHYATLLGMKRANGITLEKTMDSSPYFAFGFRVWIGGSKEDGTAIYQYYWYAKGLFSVPDASNETKKATTNFQHKSLKATFVKTLYSEDGKGDGVLVSHARNDEDLTTAAEAAWFDAPVVTTDADTGAVTVAITESAGNILITGSKVGGGSFSFAEASVDLGESLLVYSDGAEVAGTLVFSVAAVSPTITFTPDVAFTSLDDVYVTVTSAVKDNNGVSVTANTTVVTI